MENQEFQSMETSSQQQFQAPRQQIPLPNASTVLVLGIISIVGCCCYGIIGLICGIIAMVMAKNAKALYDADPTAYTESSLNNVNTGRICAIIGLVLSVLYLLYVIFIIIVYGVAILADPQSLLNNM